MISISYLFEFLGMSKQEQVSRIESEKNKFKKENAYNQEYNARANRMSSIISDFEKSNKRQLNLKRIN